MSLVLQPSKLFTSAQELSYVSCGAKDSGAPPLPSPPPASLTATSLNDVYRTAHLRRSLIHFLQFWLCPPAVNSVSYRHRPGRSSTLGAREAAAILPHSPSCLQIAAQSPPSPRQGNSACFPVPAATSRRQPQLPVIASSCPAALACRASCTTTPPGGCRSVLTCPALFVSFSR